MGLLWRPGVRSVVSGGAEYQRFFSRAPARAGSLWQIWATRRRGPGGEVGRGVRPDDRGDRFDDPVGPAGAPVREGSQRPTRSQGVSPTPGSRREATDSSRARLVVWRQFPQAPGPATALVENVRPRPRPTCLAHRIAPPWGSVAVGLQRRSRGGTKKRPRSRVNRPRGRIHHVLPLFRLCPCCTRDGL